MWDQLLFTFNSASVSPIDKGRLGRVRSGESTLLIFDAYLDKDVPFTEASINYKLC
jgi:hypothetical protein